MNHILPNQEMIRLDNGIVLNTFCWNPQDRHKTTVLLSHGTGFVAATFNPIARQLSAEFCVYSYDRRGHGLSDKPDCEYQLVDFAEDCQQLCQAMGFSSIYGVGHSAGATDLLIAESWQPGLFAKLFVMEPTINDPSAKLVVETSNFLVIQERIEQACNRRASFCSKAELRNSYKNKPLFKPWQPEILQAYIDSGFVEFEDGSLSLQCDPEIEAKVLKDIYLTFSNADVSSAQRKPFAEMAKVKCPLAVSHSENSALHFQEMARRACQHFPWAISVYFKEAGHCVPQEDPEALAREVLQFWNQY